MDEELRKQHQLESLGLLAGGIAHDFNNMLTGIFGYLDIARVNYAGKKDITAELNNMLRILNRARGLTGQLFTFSKGGAPVIAVAAVDSIIRDSISLVVSGTNIAVDFDIPESLWAAEIDASQISQVFSNLAINAVHAMPSGGRITVHAENFENNQGHSVVSSETCLKIMVSDTGQGILPENLPHIFEPFFTTKKSGNGLGLAICYSILKRHGGHIEVHSEPGVGTRFTILLPALRQTILTPAPPAPETAATGGAVLVMDDEDFVLDVADKMLVSLGYTVTTTHHGAEALELYRNAMDKGQPFRFVILDLTVKGGLGGRETIAEMKTIDPLVKAIASSGYSNDPIIADPRAFGFQTFLAKPYVISELKDVLRVSDQPS